jgi:DNA topoisomerase-3
VRGKAATVTEESKPTTQASPLLFDLTSLQREANGRFGFSAKTTLALAQSPVRAPQGADLSADRFARAAAGLRAGGQGHHGHAGQQRHEAPGAVRQQALDDGYVKPTKRVFDNTKVSDHFAIIPTLQAPSGLSDAEQKLYDLVVRRFLSVFFPSAEYTRSPRASAGRGPQLPHRRQGAGQAGLARHLRQGSGREVEDAKEGDKGGKTWCR